MDRTAPRASPTPAPTSRRFPRRLLGGTLALLLVAHLVLGGMAAGKRASWMLRRYAGCHSSARCWEERALQRPDLVELVRKRAGPDDRVLVYTDFRDLACEVAFYAFPRPVVRVIPDAAHAAVERPGNVPVLNSVRPGCWALYSRAGEAP